MIGTPSAYVIFDLKRCSRCGAWWLKIVEGSDDDPGAPLTVTLVGPLRATVLCEDCSAPASSSTHVSWMSSVIHGRSSSSAFATRPAGMHIVQGTLGKPVAGRQINAKRASSECLSTSAAAPQTPAGGVRPGNDIDCHPSTDAAARYSQVTPDTWDDVRWLAQQTDDYAPAKYQTPLPDARAYRACSDGGHLVELIADAVGSDPATIGTAELAQQIVDNVAGSVEASFPSGEPDLLASLANGIDDVQEWIHGVVADSVAWIGNRIGLPPIIAGTIGELVARALDQHVLAPLHMTAQALRAVGVFRDLAAKRPLGQCFQDLTTGYSTEVVQSWLQRLQPVPEIVMTAEVALTSPGLDRVPTPPRPSESRPITLRLDGRDRPSADGSTSPTDRDHDDQEDPTTEPSTVSLLCGSENPASFTWLSDRETEAWMDGSQPPPETNLGSVDSVDRDTFDGIDR